MSKYIGRLVNVGLGKETVRGTAVAPVWWIPKSSVAFFDRATKNESKLNYGNIGGAGVYAPKVIEWAEGTIEGDVFDQEFGIILLAVFGTDTPSGPTAGVYTHTYTLQADNQHDSLTITIMDPDRTDRYSLAMLDKLEINITPEDVAKFSSSWKSRTGRQIAAPATAYTAENKFLGRHAAIKIAATAGALAAASALSVKSLKLRISKNTIMHNILGTVWPDDIINTKFEIDGDLELQLDDQTYRQYMLDGSYKALEIKLVNSDVTIGTGTGNPTFTLDLSRVHFEGWEAVRPNDELVTQKITFHALYDMTTTNIVNSCTLTNTVASY
jgi:hypothetical protein